LYHLNDPVRYDEAFTYLNYVGGPFWEIVTNYGAPNNHFLNTLLVHLTASVLGDRAVLWRVPNLLAGLGTVILAGVIARRWFGRAAGLVALTVTAVSPVMAHFSVLARGYELSLFFGLAALYCVDKRRERPARALPTIGAAASCALACYAVPTAVLLICAVFAYDAYETYRRRGPFTELLPLWLSASLITFLLYLPALAGSGPEAFGGGIGGPSAGPFSPAGLRPYGAALVDAKTWGWGGGLLWLPVAAAGLVAGGVKHRGYAALGTAGLLAAVAVLGAGFRPPARVFIYLVPIVAIGVGAAGEWLWERLRGRRSLRLVAGGALVAAAFAAVVVAERGRYLNDSIRTGAAPAAQAMVEYIRWYYDGGLLIANAPLNYPLMYYVRKPGCDDVEVLTGRSPQAFTYEAFVAVPGGTPLREVVREGTGGGGVAVRAGFVAPIYGTELWKAFMACPDADFLAAYGR
jgi:4-amino-4-deoxy-L-arabinose transferase-like glycosyltransferase